MAYYAVFDTETGVIDRVIDMPEFLVDRISYTEVQAIAKLPYEIKDTEYKIIGDDLIRITN